MNDISSDRSSCSDDEFGYEKPAISWRQDCIQSGSDWIMAIESVPDGAIIEYPVHKRILSRGSKKSDFFSSLFALSEAKKLEHEGYSSTKVHANAATLIPEMLDFLYSSSDQLEITTETSVALRHLSEFFGIRALAARTSRFIRDDMNIDNVPTYLLCANAFDDLQIQKLAAEVCAKNTDAIEPYSEILAGMDPSFLLDVISSSKIDRDKSSVHLSMLVTAYCDMCGDLIDGTVFEELTTVEYLPKISSRCALDLMVLEEQLVADANDDNAGLTYLQKRCCAALLPHFGSGNACNEGERLQVRRKLAFLPSKVLLELLSASLCIC